MIQAIINEELFKEFAPIQDATLVSNFVPYVGIAQQAYFTRLLGAPLLTELQEQVKAASVKPAPVPSPITPENRALIMQIAPALSWYTVYQGLPFHWAKIVNKGVTFLDSENSGAVNIDGLAQIRRWMLDTAQALEKNLIDYLCSCGKYPLWMPRDYCRGNCEGAKYSPFESGIYIPKRRR